MELTISLKHSVGPHGRVTKYHDHPEGVMTAFDGASNSVHMREQGIMFLIYPHSSCTSCKTIGTCAGGRRAYPKGTVAVLVQD